MSSTVTIVKGPLRPAPPHGGCGEGAWLRFEGVVRPLEVGQPLKGLDYEDYPPMTKRELERLADQIMRRHKILGIHVVHSVGFVPVGACSFRLDVLAEHRKPALAAMDLFIDRMKQAVPLWKTAVWQHEAAGMA